MNRRPAPCNLFHGPDGGRPLPIDHHELAFHAVCGFNIIILGSGTALTDAAGGVQGTVPDTITYDFGATVAGRVTAVIARVLPGVSGNLTFTVNITSGTAAGKISNPVTYTYDPGTGTPIGPYNTNAVDFTVTQNGKVTMASDGKK